MSFHDLVAHFVLVINNILLSAVSTVLFIHSPTEVHLGCFQVLAFWNKAATNLRVCRFLCGYSFSTSLGKDQGV